MHEILNRYIISVVEEPFKIIFVFLNTILAYVENISHFMQTKYMCYCNAISSRYKRQKELQGEQL